MNKVKYITATALIGLVAVSGLVTSACASTEAAPTPPFVPPEYYDCTEVDPQALLNIYFTGYGDFTATEARYNERFYVFKDVLVDERMFTGLEEGFIWVDYIKCYLVNPDDMNRFEVGDRVDVVGRNKGPTSYVIAGLKFNECLVLPANSVALPADENAGSITPGY